MKVTNYMKAAVYDTYGSPEVITIQEVPAPKLRPGCICIKIHAAAVTAADARIRSAHFPKGFTVFGKLVFGVCKPRRHILGSCFSGVVSEIGAGVTGFLAGEEVCGMSGIGMGAHAEYIVVKANKVVKKPAKVSHEDAAAVLFGGTAALYFLRDKGGIKKGYSVLINGASGAVGSMAVQLAKHFGASVTASARGEHGAALQQLGADKVVDYTKQSLDDIKQSYDIMLDTAGNIPIKQGVALLKPTGKLLLMVATLRQMLFTKKQTASGTATEKPEDIAFLLKLLESGEMKAVIDSTYSLSNIVDAHKRLSAHDKFGTVIVEV